MTDITCLCKDANGLALEAYLQLKPLSIRDFEVSLSKVGRSSKINFRQCVIDVSTQSFVVNGTKGRTHKAAMKNVEAERD